MLPTTFAICMCACALSLARVVCYVKRHCVWKYFACSIRESVYFSFHKCKDSLTNRFDDLTADRCKTRIGYRVPCMYGITSMCGSAHADARLGIPGAARVEIAVSRSKRRQNRQHHKKIIAFSIAQYENQIGMLFRFFLFLGIFGRSNVGNINASMIRAYNSITISPVCSRYRGILTWLPKVTTIGPTIIA